MGPSLESGPFYPEDRTSSGHTPGDLDAEAGALKGAADSTCHPPAELKMRCHQASKYFLWPILGGEESK